MPREFSVGAIIIRKERGIKFLLLYKKAHGIYKEGWYFTRGLIEKGEEEEETIRREIKEETGIEDLFFVKGFKEKVHWFYRNEKKETVYKEASYRLAETRTEKVKLSGEHDDHGWYSYDVALTKLKFKNDKDVLKKVKEFLEDLG
jgi:8-oxo-dGTP pyrophosphatase MutT (NUDIX family)